MWQPRWLEVQQSAAAMRGRQERRRANMPLIITCSSPVGLNSATSINRTGGCTSTVGVRSQRGAHVGPCWQEREVWPAGRPTRKTPG